MIPNNSNQTVVSGINALSAIIRDGDEIPEYLIEPLCRTLSIQQAIMTKNIKRMQTNNGYQIQSVNA